MPDQSFRDEVFANLASRRRYQTRVAHWKERVRRDLSSLHSEHERREYFATLDVEFCRRSFYYFLTQHWLTFWPDGPKFGKEVEQHYPASRMAWVLATLVNRCNDSVVDICKGRQIPMASHFFCAYFCWDCMFHPGRMVLFHSKSLFHVGANAKGNPETLLGRVQFGYKRLPRYLQAIAPADFDFNAQRPQAIFYHRGIVADAPLTSTIMGVPDSYQADSATSFSPSAIFDDERGHQKNAKGFFETAIPAMMGRLFVRVGTPNSAEFTDALQDMRTQIAATEDADGNPETDWEELMPYSDSFSGEFLKQIMNNETDYELGFRFLARRRRNGIVTCKIHFRARPPYGKNFRAKEVNKIADPVRRAEEHDCEMFAIDVKSRVWKLSEYGSRHYEYDTTQHGEFRRIIRAWDFGKRSAVQFWQKVKMGPLPNSFQLRCLGEVCSNGPLVREVARLVHDRMVQWFPNYDPRITPCIDYPDVAGRQSNRQTGQTDIQVTTDEMRKYEPLFHAIARKIGVDEGVDEMALKMAEVLGYDEKSNPIPGLVVSPLRAPITHRAFSGALRQDDKGRISKSKENKEYEHVGDCGRYTAAREVRRADVVRDGSATPTDARPKPGLTLDERKARVNAWMDGQLEAEIERQRNLGNMPINKERFHEEV